MITSKIVSAVFVIRCLRYKAKRYNYVCHISRIGCSPPPPYFPNSTTKTEGFLSYFYRQQASRAQILKKAAEYIQFMRKKNTTVQTDIDKIAHENKALEEQSECDGVVTRTCSVSHSTWPSALTDCLPIAVRLVESQGGLNGSGISLSSQSLSLLTSEPTDVSSSYDISENSNESASNDLSPSPPMNGRNHHNGLDKSIVNNSEQLLINGTNSVVRSAVVKNGTNTIIVQNPQLKSNSHVIHVTTTGHNNSSNISSSSSTSTPLIISTLPNVKSTGGAGSVGGNAGSGSNGNSYIINKTTNTILSNGYQAVMVQPSSTNSSTGGTTTPNIHIVNSIPSSYSGRTKRFKISTGDSDSASSVVVAAAAATGNGSTTQSSFNVTSVSS